MCKRTIEIPQELGRVLLLLLGKSRLEIPGYQLQALAVHSSAKERTQRVHPRYRQAKETKCGEMAVGCRSTRIVLMKPGNWSRRTRWREGKTERGCLMLDPGSGNTSEASNLELRINDTAQDSIPGMQRCCMANPSLEEPYALMCARTGLWEPWVSNHPGPPGPNARSKSSSAQRWSDRCAEGPGSFLTSV